MTQIHILGDVHHYRHTPRNYVSLHERHTLCLCKQVKNCRYMEQNTVVGEGHLYINTNLLLIFLMML